MSRYILRGFGTSVFVYFSDDKAIYVFSLNRSDSLAELLCLGANVSKNFMTP